METMFYRLIQDKNFEGAQEILREALQKAEIIHPRKDDTWVPVSDMLGFSILQSGGISAYSSYWEGMLRFFERELEPKWGHLCKSHILFRLGFGKIPDSFPEARHHLDRALAEDIQFEEQYQQEAGIKRPILDTLSHFPSYIVLCFLDLIKDERFAGDDERRRFFRGMATLRWDPVHGSKEVDPDVVIRAIERLVPPDGVNKALKVYRELMFVTGERIPAAIHMLSRLTAETVLYGLLVYRAKVKTIGSGSALRADLYGLIEEASRLGLFPSDSVFAVFMSVALVSNNLYRRKVDCTRYTEQVEIGLAVGLKTLLENALIDWGHAAPASNLS